MIPPANKKASCSWVHHDSAPTPFLTRHGNHVSAFAAMTLRSIIFGSSNGDIIRDESNSVAICCQLIYLLVDAEYWALQWPYARFSAFLAALGLGICVENVRLLLRCVLLSVYAFDDPAGLGGWRGLFAIFCEGSREILLL